MYGRGASVHLTLPHPHWWYKSRLDAQVTGRGVHVAYVPIKKSYSLSLLFRCTVTRPPVHLKQKLYVQCATPPAHLKFQLGRHNRVGDGSTQAQCRSSLVKAVGSGRWRVAFEVWVRLRVIALERRWLHRQPPDPRHTSVWQSLPLLHNAQHGCRMVDLAALEPRVLKNDH